VAPCGIVNSRTAAEVVPEFVTVALVPGLPVVVEPTVTVAAAPSAPGAPAAPSAPFCPTIILTVVESATTPMVASVTVTVNVVGPPSLIVVASAIVILAVWGTTVIEVADIRMKSESLPQLDQ
jgi:hypothetical protein